MKRERQSTPPPEEALKSSMGLPEADQRRWFSSIFRGTDTMRPNLRLSLHIEETCYSRLLDLKLLEARHDPRQNLYAYHWTPLASWCSSSSALGDRSMQESSPYRRWLAWVPPMRSSLVPGLDPLRDDFHPETLGRR